MAARVITSSLLERLSDMQAPRTPAVRPLGPRVVLVVAKGVVRPDGPDRGLSSSSGPGRGTEPSGSSQPVARSKARRPCLPGGEAGCALGPARVT